MYLISAFECSVVLCLNMLLETEKYSQGSVVAW